MRRIGLAATLLALTVSLGATSASAQGFVGGGLLMPMGDFKDGAKMGWVVNAGFRPFQSADKRMSLWAEGLYGSNSLKNVTDGKTTMFGGFGSVTYNLTADASAVP